MFKLALFLISQAVTWWPIYYMGWLRAGNHFGGDFPAFWDAAQKVGRGAFGEVYNHEFWARQIATGSDSYITWFVYPPPSLFGVQLFSGMTYAEAVAVWSLAPLPFYIALLVLLARRPSGERMPMGWKGEATLAMMPLLFLHANLFTGQSGALLAVLLLAAGYFWTTRPIVAGLFLGLLAVKPQLGLLIPFALAASGQWRMFAAAAAAVSAMVAASLLWLGLEVWADYIQSTRLAGEYFAQHSLYRLALAPYPSLVSIGAPVAGAMVAQVVISLAVLASIVAAFGAKSGAKGASGARLDLSLAMLATGALLATPYAMTYDTPLLALALLPLFGRAWRGEGGVWERWTIVALVLIPFGQQVVGRWVPYGFMALILTHVVLARALLRATQDHATGRAARRMPTLCSPEATQKRVEST